MAKVRLIASRSYSVVLTAKDTRSLFLIAESRGVNMCDTLSSVIENSLIELAGNIPEKAG